MTPAEKIEIVLIPLFGTTLWMIAPGLPEKVESGILLLGASALLLLQGLIRDLWLLAKGRRKKQAKPPRRARCMCLESTIGAIGIVTGIVVLLSETNRSVVMNNWTWSFPVMGVMTMGYLIKDYVLKWNPFRILRDKDHMHIIFSWKK